MSGPFKMKIPGLNMSAKSGSPMQANYASPAKKDEEEKVDISNPQYYINNKGIVDQKKKAEYLAAAASRKENKGSDEKQDDSGAKPE